MRSGKRQMAADDTVHTLVGVVTRPLSSRVLRWRADTQTWVDPALEVVVGVESNYGVVSVDQLEQNETGKTVSTEIEVVAWSAVAG